MNSPTQRNLQIAQEPSNPTSPQNKSFIDDMTQTPNGSVIQQSGIEAKPRDKKKMNNSFLPDIDERTTKLP